MQPYITSITAQNIKQAADTSIDLSPLTIIQGDNGSGKSAIKDALNLALLGYHPDLGKKGPALAKLAGPGLVFGGKVKFSNGAFVSRSWKKTKTGASAQPGNDDIPPLDLSTLEPGAFLSLTPAKQAALIAARSGIEGDPKQAIIDKVKASLPATLADALALPTEEDFSLWAEQFAELLAESSKEAGAVARRMTTTLEGMMSLEADVVETISREVIEAARQVKAEAAAYARRLSGLVSEKEQELDGMAPMPSGYDLPEKSATELRAELDQVEYLLRPYLVQYAEYSASASARRALNLNVETIEQAVKRRRLKLDATEPRPEISRPPGWEDQPNATVTAALNSILEQERKAHTAAQVYQGRAEVTLQAVEAQALTGSACSCCGATRAHWDEQKVWDSEQAIETAKIVLKTAQASTAEKAANIEQIEESVATWKAYLESLAYNADRDAQVSELARNELELTEARAKLSELPVWEMDQAEAKEELEETKADLERDIASHASQAELSGRQQARTALEAELATLRQQSQEAATTAENAAQELAALEAKATAADAAAARALEQEKARKQAEDEGAKKAAWDIARDVLAKACNEETVKVFKPLLEVARQITDGCLPTDLDNNGLELGRFDGAHFIGLSTFSTSEKYAATAGILCALAAQGSGFVLIDEFSTFGDSKKVRFVENLAAAIEAGTLAQAILLDSRAYPGTLPSLGSVVTL